MKKKAALSASIPYHPLVYFLIFLTVNIILSYFNFPLVAQLWLFLLGILLPFVTALTSVHQNSPKGAPLYRERTLGPIPIWVWILVALAGVAWRLYQLFRLHWPMPDEGIVAYYSIELARHWTWHWFFAMTQNPPLFNWFLALFFKVLSPSLLSMWLFPALFGILTMAATYGPIRRFFSDSFCLFFFFLLSASLWPIYMNHICCVWPVGFLFEFIVLILLGSFWMSPPRRARGLAFALGLFTGLGFFSTIPWVVFAAPVGFAFFVTCLRAPAKQRWKTLSYFAAPFGALFLLFAVLSIRENNGDHIRSTMAFAGGAKEQILDWTGYVRALFWGIRYNTMYRPFWGGMLNPVLGSLLFLGLVECWKSRRSKLIQWVFLALVCCWAPAILSSTIEIFRVFLTIPFLFFITGMGFQSFLKPLIPRLKPGMALLIVFSSVALDFHHMDKYLDPYLVVADGQSRDYSKTYGLLKSIEEKKGPGALLTNLGPDMDNQRLIVYTYAFNAAYNSRWSFEDCQWVAVIANESYKPLLAARFPNSFWFALGEDRFWKNENRGLIVIPVDPSNRQVLKNWFDCERLLQPVTLDVFYAREHADQKPFIDRLNRIYEKVKSDRFLASTLVERVLFYKQQDGNPPDPLELVQLGLKDGYPLRNFYNVEAVLLYQQGRHAEAKRAYSKAAKAAKP